MANYPGFQTSVGHYLAPAVEGDFASADVRTSQLAYEGQLVAGEDGVTIGRFAWLQDGLVYNKGTVAPAGFIHRENLALITSWLGGASMVIPYGREITILTQGAFWAKTSTDTEIGEKVFASETDGSIATGEAGATIDGFVETHFYVGNAVSAGELVQISTWIYGVNGTGA